ncbi:MAG: hypothetical protein WBI82_06930 [Sphaerochaeta sp.]
MYFDLEQGLVVDEAQFIQTATEAGVEASLLDDFLHCFVLIGNTRKVVLVGKTIALLRKQHYPVSLPELSEILRISYLKFSGTDGIRGIVDSTNSLTNEQSVQVFLQERILSPKLGALLASGFASMLRECKPSLRQCVAIAEDGRDNSEMTGLVSAIMKALQVQGFEVENLGVIPTPALAAWSLDKGCGAIMVTASHNPHQYNGMKFFIEGHKLFPEGPCGEFALSFYALESVGKKMPDCFGNPLLCDKHEQASALFVTLFGESLSVQDKEELNGCHFVIDCANGATSYVLPSLMQDLGLSFQLVSEKPGKQAINKDCGAALFEGIYSVCTAQSTLSPLVTSLFAIGPRYRNKRVFGIALDGDGDRGMVLVPNSEGSAVSVLHGDELLLLVSRRSVGLSGVIRVTIESDSAICSALKALSPDFAIEVTGVGDRHLSLPPADAASLLAGGEDSGHLVFPVQVGKGTLFSGNGLLSALVSISVLVAEKLTLPLFVRKGVDKRSVGLQNTGLWYSHSVLWNEVESAVAKYFCDALTAVRFACEPDMLSYRTEDDDLLYVRASGTEPKLNVSFTHIGDTGFNMLVQSILGICASCENS